MTTNVMKRLFILQRPVMHEEGEGEMNRMTRSPNKSELSGCHWGSTVLSEVIIIVPECQLPSCHFNHALIMAKDGEKLKEKWSGRDRKSLCLCCEKVIISGLC